MGIENLHLLGPDERRVVGRIVDRLLLGQKVYGEMHLAFDKRNFREEGAYELLDFLVYLAAREISDADKAPRGIDELASRRLEVHK